VDYKRIDFTKEVAGAALMGSIEADFDDLIDIFGDPDEKEEDFKSQVEWILKFDDGTIAVVYDWKEGVTPDKVKEWNVGGHRKKAYYYVRSLIVRDRRQITREVFEGKRR
jgi:hypothetical protein